MMYKQLIIDKYETYDVELDLIDNKMQLLDLDTEEIEDLDSYNLEDRFEDMFSPHVITVQLFDMDEDECTDVPVYEHSFRCPYQG